MAVVNEGALKKMLKVSVYMVKHLLVNSKLANVIDTKLGSISQLAKRCFLEIRDPVFL